ncbi:hypothetical protein NP233_g8329 [Leucocoprinus birnbaumii]|uniref:Inner centromere protein ARK-binding domain-containing protein n=1 Tax=Leucocoprinus birnbaumii TaxID=56174 RepID=A0AAD5VMJ6_9AGAR|nr:hypothetical protein NP233_g8329 [Leucocoprinus birnbaumii]
MVNDPGRKLFQEQVQTHGFSFLDDYLENILAGAKQDPLIELVKTPGRKKAISRKPKLVSQMTQMGNVSPEPEQTGVKKQDRPPNRFTQALLDAKSQPSESKESPQAVFENMEGSMSSDIVLLPKETTISAQSGPVELSVIDEDDEATERSQPSIHPVNSPGSGNLEGRAKAIPSPMSNLDDKSSEQHAKPQSTNMQESGTPIEVEPQELEEVEGPAVIDITVPIRDVETKSSSPTLSARKSVLSTLPTLPEPIPLRKSMRATKEPAAGPILIGAVTPGNNTLGKRTSWLMKAREVKAMEGVPKKSGLNKLSNVPPTIVGAKRKSEEAIDSIDTAKDERNSKVSKQTQDDTAPRKATSPTIPESNDKVVEEVYAQPDQEGAFSLLKKKAQTLESRNDKLSDKVLRDAAAALAEARAKAEARIAERQQEEAPGTSPAPDVAVASPHHAAAETERRFSISDLFPSDGKVKDKSKASQKSPVFVAATPKYDSSPSFPANDESTSTTPPHSPPPATIVKASSVFNNPPPVFVPPAPHSRPLPTPPALKETSFVFAPPPIPLTKPTTITLGISPRLGSPTLGSQSKITALSAQSTMESVRSDDLFGDRGNTEAWVPSTQDTEYSSAFGSQQAGSGHQVALDDDDSWPIDEKLSQGGHWPFGAQSKEDSMTWSTLPSQSQRNDTDSASKETKNQEQEHSSKARQEDDMEIEHEDFNTGADGINTDHELEDMILSGVKSVSDSLESEDNQGPSSLISSVSSQSQVGFFGQASKFLSSALGTSKKAKPEVKKVMQMAAVAAKKQQQEDDKKAARLKEMENRRQLAMQRKTEEEKARQQEQERKAKEEVERRKREREEHADKKPLKSIGANTSSKKEEETTKKRKVEHDKSEKKLDSKKQTPLTKTGFKPTSKQTNALSSSAVYNTSQSTQPTALPMNKLADKTSKVPTAIPTKGKAKQKPPAQAEEDHPQPSQIIQTQMAARAKAAMQTDPRVPSESIELPEVNSEYSDSEDEDRPRAFDPPEWAQSPELRQALQAQSTINPDNIFGAIRPLRMEEMFRARTSRFRARTSSANWSGADRLTMEEEREYARRMGFK